MDIAELSEPVEVWRAVEGDSTDLIALLRSDEPLNRWTRNELANWLAGDLQPIKLPRGAVPKSITSPRCSRAMLHMTYGYDLSTELGMACFRYERARRYVQKRGWHKKGSGIHFRKLARLKDQVVEKQEVNFEQFNWHLRRGKGEKPGAKKKWSGADYIKERRTQIHLEIRRAKKRLSR